MKRMFRIVLNNNQITKVICTATENMPSVRDIILSDNKLTTLDVNDFAKFVNLKKLSLDGNQLTFITGYPMARQILPKIEYIAINRNELTCAYLKEIAEPYMETYHFAFWYENEDRERSCSEPKSVYYKEQTCCYP